MDDEARNRSQAYGSWEARAQKSKREKKTIRNRFEIETDHIDATYRIGIGEHVSSKFCKY